MFSVKNKIAVLIASMAALVSTASATINTANITDAIALIGTVGGAFITALGTIFVDNLGTILTLVAVGVVILVFGGFGKLIVKFMNGMLGNLTGQMSGKGKQE